MTAKLPPIFKVAHRVRLDIELAVLCFARIHKYQIGAVLRSQALDVLNAANRAWRDRAEQLARVSELALAIDDLHFTAQLAKDVKAFASFGQFEVIANSLHELGQQCGGWHRSLHRNGQNSAASKNAPKRAEILSAHGASSSEA